MQTQENISFQMQGSVNKYRDFQKIELESDQQDFTNNSSVQTQDVVWKARL